MHDNEIESLMNVSRQKGLNMSRTNVLKEVDLERDYQDKIWGHHVDDTMNTPWMWISYICSYSTRWMLGTFIPLGSFTTDNFRTCMIKVAAIAVAAVESLDRQRAANGKAFYE